VYSGSRSSEFWRVIVALLVLYLVMSYLPDGIALGWLVIAGLFLSTPDAVQGLISMIQSIGGG
jgi:hypothetical protein